MRRPGPAARLGRWGRVCAAVLLMVQASADMAAALPHAGDAATAPTTLESHHSALCVRLHDAAQCAQCQYHALRPLPATAHRLRAPASASRRPGPSRRAPAVLARSVLRSSPPRAPPPPPTHS